MIDDPMTLCFKLMAPPTGSSKPEHHSTSASFVQSCIQYIYIDYRYTYICVYIYIYIEIGLFQQKNYDVYTHIHIHTHTPVYHISIRNICYRHLL